MECLPRLARQSVARSMLAVELLNNNLLLQVKEGYFQGLVEAGRVTQEDFAQHIFASKPASGGAVLTLKL